MLLPTIIVSTLTTFAVAHGAHEKRLAPAELQTRSLAAKQCADRIGQMNRKRMNKRNVEKRWETSGRNTTYEITTEAPYYDSIQNDTCVLTPEVTRGPYVWPRSQTLRQDMTEDQVGVPLWLDIGVIDIETCEPLPNALVDFWHCNSTGSYSSFTELSPNTDFETLLTSLNVTDFDLGVTDLHTDNTTWLRGMWPTDDTGMMEMKTIFPGFYINRAIHIHVQVHLDWAVRGNGTLIAENTVSTGQIYFEESVQEQIMALDPYSTHTQINRTTNADDSVFDQDTDGGYNPVVSVVAADGEDIRNGMIGYITIGVNTTAIEDFSSESEGGGQGGPPSN